MIGAATSSPWADGVLQAAGLLVAFSVFGRILVWPLIRFGRAIYRLVEETREVRGEMWAMVDGYADHEQRLHRLERHAGITPGPMHPRPHVPRPDTTGLRRSS